MIVEAWSSASELQELVDALAADLGRPVGIDDQRFAAIAYSPHEHDYDDVRAASILRRQAPREVVAWLDALGVRRATAELRIPANRELGMAARVCVPLRCAEITLGYLWLIDEPTPIEPDELARALASARRAAALVYRMRLLKRDDRKHEQALVATLLHGEPGPSRRAAAELLEAGLLEAAAAYAVLAVRPCRPPRARVTPEALGAQITECVERLRRMLPPHRMLAALLNDQGAAILACPIGEDPRRRAETLRGLVAEACAPLGIERVVVGISGSGDVEGLRDAYWQARDAAGLAETVASLGDLVGWDELGAYATMLRMRRGGEALPAAVPEPLWRLLRSPDADPLVETLEIYLESAADASATAARIYVHRSSLYGRLRRIEEITGIDLRDGDDRLLMHLGLRLWRMAGSPPAPAGALAAPTAPAAPPVAEPAPAAA